MTLKNLQYYLECIFDAVLVSETSTPMFERQSLTLYGIIIMVSLLNCRKKNQPD
jgi:hypothetical protein